MVKRFEVRSHDVRIVNRDIYQRREDVVEPLYRGILMSKGEVLPYAVSVGGMRVLAEDHS